MRKINIDNIDVLEFEPQYKTIITKCYELNFGYRKTLYKLPFPYLRFIQTNEHFYVNAGEFPIKTGDEFACGLPLPHVHTCHETDEYIGYICLGIYRGNLDTIEDKVNCFWNSTFKLGYHVGYHESDMPKMLKTWSNIELNSADIINFFKSKKLQYKLNLWKLK